MEILEGSGGMDEDQERSEVDVGTEGRSNVEEMISCGDGKGCEEEVEARKTTNDGKEPVRSDTGCSTGP